MKFSDYLEKQSKRCEKIKLAESFVENAFLRKLKMICFNNIANMSWGQHQTQLNSKLSRKRNKLVIYLNVI